MSSIPAWNSQCIIPPLNPNVGALNRGTDSNRSPYKTNLIDVVQTFGTSSERCEILNGFIEYGELLQNSLGIETAIHWLNGSFMQNIEVLESRAPRDIDVVTFFKIPDGETQESLILKCPDAFTHGLIKNKYKVDGYLLPYLGQEITAAHISKISYWYSMWSHQRNGFWKGFLQTDFNPQHFSTAKTMLNKIVREGFER